VYATDVINGRLLEIDVDDGDYEVIADGLSKPEGFDVAPDGTIVLAEVGKQRIVRIDPDNGEISEIARNLAIGLAPAENTPPGYIQTGVAVSDSGNIYVSSDLNTAMYKITPQ
jgi:sugar lactone lactonase YvrE